MFTKSLEWSFREGTEDSRPADRALAENEVTLPVVAHNAPTAAPKTIALKEEWQRWNDYGIGLFLQGDLKGAAAAFQKVTEADPNNPDGWVNIGRCAVQEGDMERARTVLEKALSLSPNLARANYLLRPGAALGWQL